MHRRDNAATQQQSSSVVKASGDNGEGQRQRGKKTGLHRIMTNHNRASVEERKKKEKREKRRNMDCFPAQMVKDELNANTVVNVWMCVCVHLETNMTAQIWSADLDVRAVALTHSQQQQQMGNANSAANSAVGTVNTLSAMAQQCPVPSGLLLLLSVFLFFPFFFFFYFSIFSQSHYRVNLSVSSLWAHILALLSSVLVWFFLELFFFFSFFLLVLAV